MEGQWGLFSAIASSLSLAIMIVFDRIMIGDCYRDSPRQAWLVSSVAGAIFGLAATMLMWVTVATGFQSSVLDVGRLAVASFFPQGLIMVFAGAVSNQVLCHYFRLFVPRVGEDVNETAIALWLALAPFAIFTTSSFLSTVGVPGLAGTGLAATNTNWSFGLAVLGAIAALISFELCASDRLATGSVRFAEIAKMLGAIVVYTLTISGVLRADGIGDAELLALQPYYWIGFLSGARVLANKADRVALIANIRRLRKFLPLIVSAEIVGMAVYMFEFMALGAADATLVNLIIGAHVLAVFGLSVALSLLRRRMEALGRRRVWFFGLRFVSSRLPENVSSPSKLACLGLAHVMLLLALFVS